MLKRENIISEHVAIVMASPSHLRMQESLSKRSFDSIAKDICKCNQEKISTLQNRKKKGIRQLDCISTFQITKIKMSWQKSGFFYKKNRINAAPVMKINIHEKIHIIFETYNWSEYRMCAVEWAIWIVKRRKYTAF